MKSATFAHAPPPRISIIMPVYNRAGYCAEAIESILCQTMSDFEFIIVDDGSSDSTVQVIERFAWLDSRIRLFRHASNLGIVAALNRGLAHARAALIARMDSDDQALPHRLERQADFMDRNPDILAAGSRVLEIDAAGKSAGSDSRRVPENPSMMRKTLLERGTVMYHPTVVMRRESVTRVGGYRPAFEFAEDYDLWLRLSEIGFLGNIQEVLLRYRAHAGSISSRKHFLQSYRALIARYAGKRRARGETDPFDTVTRHDERIMIEMLELSGEEGHAFWMEHQLIRAREKGVDIASSSILHDRRHIL